MLLSTADLVTVLWGRKDIAVDSETVHLWLFDRAIEDSVLSIRGMQEPEYRNRLRQELAFFNRSWSRTRSGYFWLKQDPEKEWFLFTGFLRYYCLFELYAICDRSRSW